MIAAGRLSAISAARDAVVHDLGEDVQLADPAGDQLGVLGAEVDDEHGVAVVNRPVVTIGTVCR